MNDGTLKAVNSLFDKLFEPINAAPQAESRSNDGLGVSDPARGIPSSPAVAAPLVRPRFNRQRMLESEIVEFRPDYNEAMELLDSLQTGLALKMGPHGDDLPVDVEHCFKKLRGAINEADELHYRKTYDPRDQYTGYEEDFDDK